MVLSIHYMKAGPKRCNVRLLFKYAWIRFFSSEFITIHEQLTEKMLASFIRQNFQLFTNNNPYPTAFPYGNGMVLHFYQQQESSTTKTVHKVINKGLKAYV